MEPIQLPGWYINTLAFVFGAFWGSFANVCIWRIPAGVSIVWPPSRCPECLSPIRARHNIPIAGWILLGGRCRDCLAGISVRYPFVELLTGLLSLALAMRSAEPSTYIAYFPLLLMLVVLTFIDIDHWLLPDFITLPGIAAGFAFSFFHPVTPAGIEVAPFDSAAGAAAGAGSLYLVALAFKLATGRLGMGGGDIKLMGMLGAFLGWKAILPVIFLSAVQGSAAGILLLIVRSRRFGEEYRAAHPGDNFAPTRSHIPYGPFISLAAVEYLFFGPVIFDVVSFFQG